MALLPQMKKKKKDLFVTGVESCDVKSYLETGV